MELTAIDLTPGTLEHAGRRAQSLKRNVTLLPGDAHELNFPDDQFDTVVATLLLSTIPDDRRAAAEAWRVLKPGGKLLLLDHVRSSLLPVRWLQRLVDLPVAQLMGVHLLRDPLDYLGAIGFVIEHRLRPQWGVVQLVVARKVPVASPAKGAG